MDERPPFILPCAGQCPDRHIHFQGTTRQGRGCVEGAQRWHRLLLAALFGAALSPRWPNLTR